jgi:ATP-dependent DNA helicase DinG
VPAPADPKRPPVREVLATAVEALGGQERTGQIAMAEAVSDAFHDQRHLVVQAGTGTGKSLAYLVPALLHDRRVVVATATLALQLQLVERDIPRLVEAVKQAHPEVDASYAVLKGRSNYACLHRIREGVPDEQGALIEVPEGSLGKKVLELRSWAEKQAQTDGSGERDNAPRHTDREWRQVSVSHRDCLGAARCPFGEECFVEQAREKAHRSHLIVTNHSLLAIDAIEGVPMIPDYHTVVVDEAHELVARVTQAETDELALPLVERAARRARNFVDGPSPEDLTDAADVLRAAFDDAEPGRYDVLPEAIETGLAMVRDAARTIMSGFPKESPDAEADAARQQARGLVDEVRKIADRMVANREDDVVWLAERDPSRGGRQMCVAPLQVWSQLRDKLLTAKTVVCTSATLKLGGDFTSLAVSIGLVPAERVEDTPSIGIDDDLDPTDDEEGPTVLPWRAIDVGSPFDYPRQGILYVARSLPPPGRDGIGHA